ncbi:MAG: YceD family protein [Candidatus Binataceae bacterium]
MKIKVDDIGAEVRALSFPEPETELNRLLDAGKLHETRFVEPIGVAVSYYRAGPELFFEGELIARTRAVCARCAEEFTSTTDRPFRFILSPRSLENVNGDAGRAEYSLYDGDEVDLTPLIREELLLAMPTRPLCREDCRGLCPHCGINLNYADCNCRPEANVLRLAVLRTLKIQRG